MIKIPDDWRERDWSEETLDLLIQHAPGEWGGALVEVRDTFHAMLLVVRAEGFGNDQLLALELTRLAIERHNFRQQSQSNDLQ